MATLARSGQNAARVATLAAAMTGSSCPSRPADAEAGASSQADTAMSDSATSEVSRSWVQMSNDQVEDTSKVIFYRESDTRSNQSLAELQSDQSNSELSLLITIGTELAKDPRVQSAFAERLDGRFAAPGGLLADHATAEELSVADTPDFTRRASADTNSSDGRRSRSSSVGQEDEDSGGVLLMPAEDAPLPDSADELKVVIRQLQQEVANIREELADQRTLNDQLVYQNEELQETNSQLRHQLRTGNTAEAACPEGTTQQRQRPTQERGEGLAPHAEAGGKGKAPKLQQLVMKGALGIAGVLILITLMRRNSPQRANNVVAVAAAAVTAAATTLADLVKQETSTGPAL